MADDTSNDLKASDLPVVQYLDQRITFDLLATLEGGFSHFTTIETQSSESASTESSGQAGIGVSNGFAFLGVNLSGKKSKGATGAQSDVTTATLVHTPSSLFARLRSELSSRNLVHPVSTSDDLTQVREGYFVEFEATLHRIQLLELLNVLAEIAPLIERSRRQLGWHRGRHGQVTTPKQKAGGSCIGSDRLDAKSNYWGGFSGPCG